MITFVQMTWQLLLGLTIPSLIVLVAVYLMFKQYFAHQMQTFVLRNKKSRDQVTLPLKLQAYERLTLLCERIEITDLILRLQTPGSTASELQAALIMAVQQEYEHNLTQQLYISEELWQILVLAKNKTMDLISIGARDLPAGAGANEYVKSLLEYASKEPQLPSQIAKKAIKTESSLLL
jgi:hypothetical protein